MIALIAYPEIRPDEPLMQQTRRDELATEVNSWILEREGGNGVSRLERVARQVCVVQDCVNAEVACGKKEKGVVAGVTAFSFADFVSDGGDL